MLRLPALGSWSFAAVLAAGVLIRIPLLFVGSYPQDIDTFGSWTRFMIDNSPGVIYELPGIVDHLPGDLWLLYGIGSVFHLVAPDGRWDTETGFGIALKSAALLGDVAVAALLRFALDRVRPGAGVAAAAVWLLHPGVIIGGVLWAQIDVVSTALALAATLAVWRGRWAVAFPMLTWAVLIKPYLALVVPLLLLAMAHPASGAVRRPSRPWASLGMGVAAAAVLGCALVLPMATVGPFGSGPSLISRVEAAADLYRQPTLYALNLWSVLSPETWATLGGDDRRLDVLGVSYRAISLLAFAAGWLVAAVIAWRARGLADLLLACAVALTAFYVLPTRVHERYLLPAVAFAVGAAVLGERRVRAAFAVVSLTWIVSLVAAYDQGRLPLILPVLREGWVAVAGGLVAVAALAVLAWRGLARRASA